MTVAMVSLRDRGRMWMSEGIVLEYLLFNSGRL